MAALALLDDCLISLSGRMQDSFQSFLFLDLPARIETFGLLSFCCCLLGSLASKFPLPVNIGVALLALSACRSRSEAQCLCMCGAAAFTVATDVLYMVAFPSGWGAALTLLNAVLKLGAASNAYRLYGALGGGGDDELGDAEEGGSGGAAGPSSASAFPSAFQSGAYEPAQQQPDYAAIAAEAASKHSGIGDSTQYRAI